MAATALGHFMSDKNEDLSVRLGRIRHDRRGKTPRTFVAQVLKAAQKAGHVGAMNARGRSGRSTFGRGRGRALDVERSLLSSARHVVVKARVVRHGGQKFRSASLGKHVAYLSREGVTRDGADARLFDAGSDAADGSAFIARCEADRHHFRFIVSPEDAAEIEDLRIFARDLMLQAERDLGTKLDWVGVDHWNTDNPHVHVLVRGKGDDGRDLVIARDYIGKGIRARAEHLVGLELGPKPELQVRNDLAREVDTERWTRLDRAIGTIADDAGFVDLRPAGKGDADQEIRRLMVGRLQRLERLGLAQSAGPAQWTLQPDSQSRLRQLGERNDIIKSMHRALAEAQVERGGADLAIHSAKEAPVLAGRLVARGLHDELTGEAYAIVDGVDGRVHHLRFADIEATSDVAPGGIVELRRYADARGDQRIALAVRSDLALADQIKAGGATWLDRRLVERTETPLANGGFGREVRDALTARIDHLAKEGLVTRQGQRVIFARDLIATLRQREVVAVGADFAKKTGLPYRPSAEGEYATGTYRQRLTLASGRFAMLDDGLGFQLVPWSPSMERQLGRHVSGLVRSGGAIEWTIGRARGPTIG
jgi:type IV secretory pathway VirD2 relaxase